MSGLPCGSGASALLHLSGSLRGLEILSSSSQNLVDRIARLPIGVPDAESERGLSGTVLQETMGDDLHVVGGPHLDQQGEVVATESNQHVFRSLVSDHEMGEALQNLVALRMPELFIDGLHSFEIEHQAAPEATWALQLIAFVCQCSAGCSSQ